MQLSRLKQSKLARLVICGLRIPYIYLILRNHTTKRNGLSVDREGNYIPWITYPAMDFLDNVDFSDCSVFEYGSGSSTLWWASKAKKVTSIEMDESWYNKMCQLLPANASLNHVAHGGIYPNSINDFSDHFDVVVVDGAERFKCAQAAMKKLSERGMLILDNTEWYPNAARSIRDSGFLQVDFYGFPPGNSFPSITSIFFRSPGLLLNRRSITNIPVGGKVLKGGALDDL